MLILPPSLRIYLAAEPVDLRRRYDGLAGIVRSELRAELFDGHLFVLGNAPWDSRLSTKSRTN